MAILVPDLGLRRFAVQINGKDTLLQRVYLESVAILNPSQDRETK